MRELLQEGRFVVTYEPDSPAGFQIREDSFESIFDAISKIDAFGIYNNPRGRPKIDPFVYGWHLMKRYDKDIIVNVRTQDYTVPLLQSNLWGGHLLGIRNLLMVTGDYHPGSPFLIDVTEGITGVVKYLNNGYLMPPLCGRASRYYNRYLEMNVMPEKKCEGSTDFFVGAVLNPARKEEAKIYRKKLEAGARFFITQLIYDAMDIIEFIQSIEPEAPILIGSAPIISERRIKFLKKLGVQGLNEHTIKRLKNGANMAERSVEIIVEMYHTLRDFAKENNYVLGAHIMSIGNSKAAMEIIRKIEK